MDKNVQLIEEVKMVSEEVSEIFATVKDSFDGMTTSSESVFDNAQKQKSLCDDMENKIKQLSRSMRESVTSVDKTSEVALELQESASEQKEQLSFFKIK